jgi:hypothetical protein
VACLPLTRLGRCRARPLRPAQPHTTEAPALTPLAPPAPPLCRALLPSTGKKKLFEKLAEDWQAKERQEEEERQVRYRAAIEPKLVPVSDIMSGKVTIRPQGSLSLDAASPLATRAASLGKSADGLLRLAAEAAPAEARGAKAGGSPGRGARAGGAGVTVRKSLAAPRKKSGGLPAGGWGLPVVLRACLYRHPASRRPAAARRPACQADTRLPPPPCLPPEPGAAPLADRACSPIVFSADMPRDRPPSASYLQRSPGAPAIPQVLSLGALTPEASGAVAAAGGAGAQHSKPGLLPSREQWEQEGGAQAGEGQPRLAAGDSRRAKPGARGLPGQPMGAPIKTQGSARRLSGPGAAAGHARGAPRLSGSDAQEAPEEQTAAEAAAAPRISDAEAQPLPDDELGASGGWAGAGAGGAADDELRE